VSRDDDRGPEDGPQLQIWDSDARRHDLGRVTLGDEEWEVQVLAETVAADLARGRIAFQRAGRQLVTAPIIVEETEAEVLRRAEEMPESMIRQFLVSVRD
jgi:hypothetical protein